MELINLFLTFAKIGSCMFGGGYAMLPLLEREVSQKRGWATKDELMDFYALAQCTPGAIAVNVATFIGKKRSGVLGGIVATLGVVFPSVVIIGIIAAFLSGSGIAENEYVIRALKGVRAAVCAIVAVSIYRVCKRAIVDIPTAVIAVTVLAATLVFGVDPALCVVASALVGNIAYALRKSNNGGKSSEDGGK